MRKCQVFKKEMNFLAQNKRVFIIRGLGFFLQKICLRSTEYGNLVGVTFYFRLLGLNDW